MKLLARFGSLGIAVLVGACAPVGTSPETTALTLPAQRIFQTGYSLIPPNEEGWVISQRDHLLLSLAKRGDRTNEVIIIFGAPFKLKEFQSNEDFVRLVKEGQEKDTDPLRFTVVKNDITSYAGMGTTCTRSHNLLEDHQALTDSGNRVDMIREMLSFTCAHPQDKRIGITVTYSHRYYKGQRDPQLLQRATRVLDSVEFSDFR